MVVFSLTTGGYQTDPANDPAKLAAIGRKVGKRMRAHADAQSLGGDKTDLFLVPHFLEAADCERLIGVIDTRIGPSPLFKGTESDGFRTSSTHFFDENDPDVAALRRKIDSLLGIDHAFAETMQGQRYQTGQEYKHHCDFLNETKTYWLQERRRGGQRTWSAMVFLNEPEAGGETDFCNLGLAVAPQVGALLTWNNMDASGRPNRLTKHAGMPVIAGSKYVVTQWYRQDEWSLSLK